MPQPFPVGKRCSSSSVPLSLMAVTYTWDMDEVRSRGTATDG